MAELFRVDWRTIRSWRDEELTMQERVYENIACEFPELRNFQGSIIERLTENWVWKENAIKGWRAVEGRLRDDKEFRKKWIEKCRRGGTNAVSNGFIKGWEVGFRRISKRKTIGPNNELMFNLGERKIAEYFKSEGIPYEYEPLITINGSHYFPDFIVNGVIIERCGLTSPKYLSALKKKFKNYESWRGKIIVIVTKRTRKTITGIPHPDNVIFLYEEELEKLGNLLGELSRG